MSFKKENFLIKPAKLRRILNFKSLKILDCRWYLDNRSKGRVDYQKSHIPGAHFFDLEENSNQNCSLPHSLPKKEQFQKIISKLGINKKSLIIVYDQSGFFCSSRIWFTFFIYGFKRVKILDGGFKSWNRFNFPLSKIIKRTIFRHNLVNFSKKYIIKKSQIECLINNQKKEFTIIDARPSDRFKGIVPEPRENLRSGNIKGSINIPFSEIIDKLGRLKNIRHLNEIFTKKNKINNSNIICSCGSGVTACNIIFALNFIGINNVKLYDGSWAEWGKK